MCKIIALLATDDVFGIGKNGGLAWHCPQDLKIFKEKTEGNVVIMGRKTLESLPKGQPLPKRTNVILTRKTPENPIEGVVYVNSVEEALDFCKDKEKAYVIGGAEIYQAFQGKYHEVHETSIRGTFGCDTFAEYPKVNHNSSYNYESVIPPEFKEEGCIASGICIFSGINGGLL